MQIASCPMHLSSCGLTMTMNETSARVAQDWLLLKPRTSLISVDVPEDIDENDPEFQSIPTKPQFGGSTVKEVGAKTQPSMGGQGEVIPQQVVQRNSVNAEVGISKAVFIANEILNSLIQKVKSNLGGDELDLWEEYIDSYLIGKSDIDEPKLKEVLDDICDKTKSALCSQKWMSEFSGAICDRIVSDKTMEELGKAQERAEQKAEEDFISGKSDSLDVGDIEIGMIETTDLPRVIFDSLSKTLAQYCVLIAKSHLLDGKLEVDPTEIKNDNIKLSREISREVLQNLSDIVVKVYNDGMNTIGESDAIN